MRYPIYVHGSISCEDLERAFSSLGLHMRIEAGHRMVVDPVPAVVRKDPNVVPIGKAKKRK